VRLSEHPLLLPSEQAAGGAVMRPGTHGNAQGLAAIVQVVFNKEGRAEQKVLFVERRTRKLVRSHALVG